MRKLCLFLLCGLLCTANLNAQTWHIGYPNAIDVTATLQDSTLTISGAGAMTNFHMVTVPWHNVRNSIQAVVINDSVTSIGHSAFSIHSNLTSITIPYSVTSIGGFAFQGCTALAYVTIPNSVTFIGNAAFAGCTGLTSITIPNSITSIGMSTFAETGLTSITIPNSVTSIGNSAFLGCVDLTSVTIPNSVTSIEGWAFSGCTALTTITVLSVVPPALGTNVFSNVNKDSLILRVPAQSVQLYQQTPIWQNFQIEAIETENLANVQINETNFPCANFRAWLLMQPWGSKGYITEAEIENITSISVAWWNITDLTGIHFFTNLTFLHADGNQLTSLDVSMLSNLVELWCRNNQLTSLNVSGLTNLRYLYCRQNQLDSLDVSGLINLRWLGCASNRLTSLDVSDLINLETLFVDGNQLTSLDVSNLTNIHTLGIWDNQLTSLNVSGLTNLVELNVSGQQLTSLDVSGLTNLQTLEASRNQLTSLDVSGLVNLRNLWVWDNQLNSLDFSGLPNLRSLSLTWNNFTSLDVSDLTALEVLHCNSNQLTSLNISGLTNLVELWCYGNQLTSIDLTGLVGLDSLELTGSFGYLNFRGYNQTPILALRGSNNNYNLDIELNNPTELISGLSYFNGTLTSTGNTITSSPFAVEAIGNPNFALSGTLNLNYTTIITVDCEIIEEGTIGNLTWLLCADGMLIIRGFGTMPNFTSNSTRSTRSADENNAPWAEFCDMLTSVVIEEGVTTIGNNAFAGCESLQSVSIASTVESIGSGAFAGCTGLTAIIIHAETPPVIDPSAFDGVDKLNVTLHVPADSEDDYNNSDVWNEFNTQSITTNVGKTQTEQIFIFPNPVFENFTISGITENTLVSITDLHGRIVIQQMVSPNEQISVGHLSAGVYLVRVNEEVIKIVKR